MVNLLGKGRYDCFVIWGHGQPYLTEILSIVRNTAGFEIAHIQRHKAKSIKRLVSQIYSFDYAPLFHLKAKVKYLEATPKVVTFVFVKNLDCQEEYFGEGKFRHKECLKIKALKDSIRTRFNPKTDSGEISHNHVIHATDNESQTDSILKLLHHKKGVSMFRTKHAIVPVPHYVDKPSQYTIELIPYNSLLCVNAIESGGKVQLERIPVSESVQYRGLFDPSVYEAYVQAFRGTVLKQDYDLEKYQGLKKSFCYLSPRHASKYVVASKLNGGGKYLLLDGLHRASLHLYQGNDSIKVCVV